ncbi:hypothetical protein C4577_04300 [Candidatus Parcubacteria bacterium]|nr:MAG: hypothetical protein C4577_04300 [Candidatus Parcubacteria bacterium]
MKNDRRLRVEAMTGFVVVGLDGTQVRMVLGELGRDKDVWTRVVVRQLIHGISRKVDAPLLRAMDNVLGDRRHEVPWDGQLYKMVRAEALIFCVVYGNPWVPWRIRDACEDYYSPVQREVWLILERLTREERVDLGSMLLTGGRHFFTRPGDKLDFEWRKFDVLETLENMRRRGNGSRGWTCCSVK